MLSRINAIQLFQAFLTLLMFRFIYFVQLSATHTPKPRMWTYDTKSQMAHKQINWLNVRFNSSLLIGRTSAIWYIIYSTEFNRRTQTTEVHTYAHEYNVLRSVQIKSRVKN